MGTVSTFITAYLYFIGSQVEINFDNNSVANLTPVSINHQNMDIDFQHQEWIIIDSSVCEVNSSDINKYSSCTFNAKALFSEICQELTKKQSEDKIQINYKKMYCNAAANYKPIAPKRPKYSPLKISTEEKACNLLILKTMTSNDEKLWAERKEVCAKVSINK